MVLLIAIAYTTATMQGRKMKQMGIQKIYRSAEEAGQISDGTAAFIFILYGQTGSILSSNAQMAAELMILGRNKWKYYQRAEG